MAIYTDDFSEVGEWTFSNANISGGVLNITVNDGYGQRVPDANWLSGANDDFEIEIDCKMDEDVVGGFQVILYLDGLPMYLRVVGSTNDIMDIYYGVSQDSQAFVYTIDTWYTAKIRRVGTVYYYSINGGDELSYDLGATKVLDSIRLRMKATTGEFDNLVYRWIEEEEIIKTFEDTFTGTDGLLSDKNLIFSDTMLGTDAWVLPGVVQRIFSDVFVGSDNFLRDLTALFEDTFTGADIIKVDKMVIFSDTFLGADVFLVDKEAKFADIFSAIERFYASYPYPKGLKRKIIIIRDIK